MGKRRRLSGVPAKKSDNEEFEVDTVLDVRTKPDGKLEYLIRWTGYPDSDKSWEPEENLRCPAKIQSFKKRQQSKSHVESSTDAEDADSDLSLRIENLAKTLQSVSREVRHIQEALKLKRDAITPRRSRRQAIFEKIQNTDEKRITKIFEIMKDRQPGLQEEDTLELDLEKLDDATCIVLHDLLTLGTPKAPAMRRTSRKGGSDADYVDPKVDVNRQRREKELMVTNEKELVMSTRIFAKPGKKRVTIDEKIAALESNLEKFKQHSASRATKVESCEVPVTSSDKEEDYSSSDESSLL